MLKKLLRTTIVVSALISLGFYLIIGLGMTTDTRSHAEGGLPVALTLPNILVQGLIALLLGICMGIVLEAPITPRQVSLKNTSRKRRIVSTVSYINMMVALLGCFITDITSVLLPPVWNWSSQAGDLCLILVVIYCQFRVWNQYEAPDEKTGITIVNGKIIEPGQKFRISPLSKDEVQFIQADKIFDRGILVKARVSFRDGDYPAVLNAKIALGGAGPLEIYRRITKDPTTFNKEADDFIVQAFTAQAGHHSFGEVYYGRVTFDPIQGSLPNTGVEICWTGVVYKLEKPEPEKAA